ISADDVSQLRSVDLVRVVNHAVDAFPDKAFYCFRWILRARPDLQDEMDEYLDEISPLIREDEGKIFKDAKHWVKHYKLRSKHALKMANLLEQFDGDPLGAMLQSKDDVPRYALVLADASEPGRYRASYYSTNGLQSHDPFDTPLQAFEAAVKQGCDMKAEKSMDEVASTKEWRKGMQWAVLIQAGDDPFKFDWPSWEAGSA
ncbi:hypothetical protein LCGC14_3001090, partial [marine sediment metagenome]